MHMKFGAFTGVSHGASMTRVNDVHPVGKTCCRVSVLGNLN